jgi:hypothetical protein
VAKAARVPWVVPQEETLSIRRALEQLPASLGGQPGRRLSRGRPVSHLGEGFEGGFVGVGESVEVLLGGAETAVAKTLLDTEEVTGSIPVSPWQRPVNKRRATFPVMWGSGLSFYPLRRLEVGT